MHLAQLPRAERKALIRSDVREVLVRGQVSTIAGRLTHAESVQWSDKEASKQAPVWVSLCNLRVLCVSVVIFRSI